jgi:hypothetical protein
MLLLLLLLVLLLLLLSLPLPSPPVHLLLTAAAATDDPLLLPGFPSTAAVAWQGKVDTRSKQRHSPGPHQRC